MRDGGGLEPIRRAQLPQDVRNVDAGRPDTDHEGRRDLAVGVAAGDEGQDLRLARCEAEELKALLRVGRHSKRRCDLQPRALGEQLELRGQRLGSDPGRDRMRLPERPARLGAGRAGGDQRLGLAPAAVGSERRTFEPIPGRRRLRPRRR